MIHRKIRIAWFGAWISIAVASTSVRAADEWTPYKGTFPGMVGSICGKPDPAIFIAVRSRDEWVSYWEPLRPRIWQTATNEAAPIVPTPEVDFSKNIVLVASLGCKSSGGYKVEIESIKENQSELSVNVKATDAGSHCAVTAARTNPTIQVLIPQTAKKIKFNISKTVLNCD